MRNSLNHQLAIILSINITLVWCFTWVWFLSWKWFFPLNFENISPILSTFQCSCWEHLFFFQTICMSLSFFIFLFVPLFFCPLGKLLGFSHYFSFLKFHNNMPWCKFSFIHIFGWHFRCGTSCPTLMRSSILIIHW